MDAVAERLHRIERVLLWSLAVGVVLLSIPNIFFANWTASYHEFWTDSLGGKPMNGVASLLCSYNLIYRLASIALLGSSLVPVLPFRFQIQSRLALCAVLVTGLQLLTSLYFLLYLWVLDIKNGRGLYLLFGQTVSYLMQSA